MASPSTAVRVHLDTHPTHPSAVTATVTGTRQARAREHLVAGGFERVDDHTFVMVRIDREEPYWAQKTAQTLTDKRITTHITARLREAMDEEWEWANYPLPWCTREEVREVSDDGQRIYDDIRHGRLLVHAHALDHRTTVAVGTYLTTGTSVYLHGQDHLRHIASIYDTLVEALAEFQDLHGDTMRPGPAPTTAAEREAAGARTPPDTRRPASTPRVTIRPAATGAPSALATAAARHHHRARPSGS